MKNSKLKTTLWLGGLVSGIFAGYYLYQNREKLGPQKEKLSKLLADLQKSTEEIGKKIKAAGKEHLEAGKSIANNVKEQVN